MLSSADNSSDIRIARRYSNNSSAASKVLNSNAAVNLGRYKRRYLSKDRKVITELCGDGNGGVSIVWDLEALVPRGVRRVLSLHCFG